LRLIDADAFAATLDPLALVDAMREAHRAEDIGEVERLLIEEHGTANSALTWVAWQSTRGVAVKVATVFPGNAAGSATPNVQSVVILFDARDGKPLAAIHGESFTRMKTAVDSALGCDLLARNNAQTLAVLGAGAQAETHVRFLRAVRPSLQSVIVWNRTPERAEGLAETLRRDRVAATAVKDAEEAVRGADIVSCLTAATTPVLRGAWLKAGAHIDLVGGFTPTMREADDETMLRGRLFADTLRFSVAACGDFADPIARGVIGAEAIEGDLFGLCSGRVGGRRSAADVTVFKNGGGGHLDLIVARALYDATASVSRT
jgi:ornithine cyclodeaminase/alanine dehydrogenase-like protein (mu-crystallin family)